MKGGCESSGWFEWEEDVSCDNRVLFLGGLGGA